ncbi:MAG TPA: hypothetical protein VNI78_04500 [Vicinamibacterales bacterium]|nr:hypothetical protein [Vicinamibacterales bacterium]
MSLDVARAPQTITFSAPSSAFAGDVLTLTASGGSSTSTVVLVVNAPSGAGVCAVNEAQLTLLQAGTCVVTVSQDGDANYLPVSPVTVLVVGCSAGSPTKANVTSLSAAFEIPPFRTAVQK